ncbi:hypothetical protein GF371_01960 [Candidatus Woesearchaeota archaeon]|nr:hypothetical protein [Candidatus Woesearchaeota archaeon]
MNLGRLTLTLFFTSALGLSTADALAQEIPSTPPGKPKTEGEETPGEKKEERTLNEVFTEALVRGWDVTFSEWCFEHNIEKRKKWNERRKKDPASLPRWNTYENSHYVQIPWLMNEDNYIGSWEDYLLFDKLFEQQFGENFNRARLYVRTGEDGKETPFLEIRIGWEDELKLEDISNEFYQRIITVINQQRKKQEEFFTRWVFGEYVSYLKSCFSQCQEHIYRAKFGEIVRELEKRITDDKIDVRARLIQAFPQYANLGDDDVIEIPNTLELEKKFAELERQASRFYNLYKNQVLENIKLEEELAGLRKAKETGEPGQSQDALDTRIQELEEQIKKLRTENQEIMGGRNPEIQAEMARLRETREAYEKKMARLEAANIEAQRKQVYNAYQLFMYDHFVKDRHDRFDGTFGDILNYLRETIGNPRIDVREMLIKSMPGYQNYKDEDPVPIENPFRKKEEKK